MFSVILLTLAILSLGVVGVRSTKIGLQISEYDVRTKKALAIAEAGLDHMVSEIGSDLGLNGFNDGFVDELTGAGPGGALLNIGSLQSLHRRSYRFRSFGGGADDGYYVRVEDNHDESTGANDPVADNDLIVRLQSIGRVRGAERVIEATVRVRSLFPLALFGDDWVAFQGTADTDSYDSRVGGYPNGPANNGDVGSNGDIDVGSGGTDIQGDALAAGTVNDPHGAVEGEAVSGADPIPLPPVPACGPPYHDGSGIVGGTYDPATGALTGGNSEVISLLPGVFCLGSLNVKGDLMITGATVISVTGLFDLSSGALLNPGKPPDLQVFSSSTDVTKGIKLDGGPGAKAAVYAPHTAIEVSGGSDIFGALVGKTIAMGGNGAFHYDEALGTIAASDIELLGWREVRGRR